MTAPELAPDTREHLYGSAVADHPGYPQDELDAARQAVQAHQAALAALDDALARRAAAIQALERANDGLLSQNELARLLGIPASTYRGDLPPQLRRRNRD